MWRNTGAVIVGYMVLFAVVFVTFSIAFLMMGTNGAFVEGSYDVTVLWLLVSFVLGLIAAVAGGFVCAAVAKGPRTPLALAGLVLVLGLSMAVPVLTASGGGQPKTREADVGTLDAMQQAKQPVWVALANPFVGFIGVVIGARLKTGRQRADSTS